MCSSDLGYKHSALLLRRLPSSGERVLQGPGENAGVLDLGEGVAVTFKVESHNHPSAVEPYQGAATGIGGILRDIVAMGARPIALLDGLWFDAPGPQFERAVAGIDGVVECMLVSGAHDYRLKIICRDLDDYERLHREHLGRLPCVTTISSSFMLRAVPTRSEADALFK